MLSKQSHSTEPEAAQFTSVRMTRVLSPVLIALASESAWSGRSVTEKIESCQSRKSTMLICVSFILGASFASLLIFRLSLFLIFLMRSWL